MAVITHKNGTAAAVLDYDNTRELEKTIAKVAEDDAEQMAQIVNEFNSDLANIQEQIDASITSWFYTVNPTTSNPPASGWNTDEEKAAHIGDLYYNKDNGRGWRWQYVSDHYEWVEVTDQNVLDVLQSASKAQDALDSKRRNFVAQPVPPYDVGDLWSGGSQGDLKRCQTARTASESYNAADWVLATKYTDDLLASQAKDRADDAYELAEEAGEANKYVTTISGQTGISVHMANDTSNYALMNSNGYYVYMSGYKKMFVSSSGMRLYRYRNSTYSEVDVFDIDVDTTASYTEADLVSDNSVNNSGYDNFAKCKLYANKSSGYGYASLIYKRNSQSSEVEVMESHITLDSDTVYDTGTFEANGNIVSFGIIDASGGFKVNNKDPFKTFTATGTSSSVSAGSGGHITCTGTVPSGYKPIAIVQATTNHTFSGAISHMELTSNGAKIDVINTNSSGSQTYTGTAVILCTSLQSTGIV